MPNRISESACGPPTLSFHPWWNHIFLFIILCSSLFTSSSFRHPHLNSTLPIIAVLQQLYPNFSPLLTRTGGLLFLVLGRTGNVCDERWHYKIFPWRYYSTITRTLQKEHPPCSATQHALWELQKSLIVWLALNAYWYLCDVHPSCILVWLFSRSCPPCSTLHLSSSRSILSHSLSIFISRRHIKL